MGCKIDNYVVFVITVPEAINKYYNFGGEPEIITGEQCLEIVY